jgi:DNA-binding response OmpR family regulator
MIRGDRPGLDILLVEDEPTLAEMYRIKLVAEGHRVEIAPDALNGLRAIHERPPQLLLLDIRLPGMSGLELLDRIRADAQYSDLPVIILSNFGEPDVIDTGMRLGALSHLIKSQTTPASLAEVIKSVLSQAPAAAHSDAAGPSVTRELSHLPDTPAHE